MPHGNHPQGQFQTVVAARFHQCVADVTFDGAVAQHQAFCDGTIAQPFNRRDATPSSDAVSRAGGAMSIHATELSIPRRVAEPLEGASDGQIGHQSRGDFRFEAHVCFGEINFT